MTLVAPAMILSLSMAEIYNPGASVEQWNEESLVFLSEFMLGEIGRPTADGMGPNRYQRYQVQIAPTDSYKIHR